jgi:curved DNA-binding protein CbpA
VAIEPVFNANVSRTSTIHEIKIAYRKLALTLHPDRTNGDPKLAEMFKEAVEAYDTLSNHAKRTAYDRLFGVHTFERGKQPLNYRKVYSPRPPPGFKTFDPKVHYDMHYGDGIMREELERAMRREKEAAGNVEYESPLGPGFSFDSSDHFNPYSKRASQGPHANSTPFEIQYEESNFSDLRNRKMNDDNKVVNERERVRYNLHERRKERLQRTKINIDEPNNGCSVM